MSSKLSAPLYDVQVMTLDVTSRFAKPGLFQMSLSEASNENMLSNLASSDTRTKFGGRVVMIPATSLQNSKSIVVAD